MDAGNQAAFADVRSTYGYDRLGEKLSETTVRESGQWVDYGWETPDYGGGYNPDYQFETSATTLQNATASYDALGRMTETTAMRVHNARNALKLDARDLMIDRAGAARLAQKNPLQPFEHYVDKYTAQGYKGEALWQRIIQGSRTPNPIVNSKFGIK